MPRIFRRNSRKGDTDDMMTIGGFSMGTSSVSDRIMGRMRMSLSGISGRNLNSAGGDDSLDSGSNSGGKSSRISLRSMPSFTRRRRSNSVGKLRIPMPGLDRESANVRNGSSSSNVIDGMMAEMDSTETMALSGRSMGRRAPIPLRSGLERAPSTPALRSNNMTNDRFWKPRKEKLNKSNSRSQSSRHLKPTEELDKAPMEFSLVQLRQMSELELEKTLDTAGIPFEEVDEEINKIASMNTNTDPISEENRKNVLVMLLINSGKVKLVRADKARRDSTFTLQASNHSLLAESTHKEGMYDETDSSVTSLPYNDEGGSSIRSELSVASSTRGERRKSKLDKILELQTENSKIKRENKSLKKTVKKLLEQLTNMTQKEKEAVALAEKYRKEAESSGSVEPKVEKDRENAQEDAALKAESDDVQQVVICRKGSDLSVDTIKQSLKDEKHAHQNTEFRFKAEIDLLTREVEGLQKELTQSLKSLKKKEQSAREYRETSSKLKRKLNYASSTVSKLKNEAKARDKLIESFTKILLQKISFEGYDKGNEDESTVGGNKTNLSELEQSLKMTLTQDVMAPVEE